MRRERFSAWSTSWTLEPFAGCLGVARHRSAVYPPARTTKPTSRPTRTQVRPWAPSCDRSCDRSKKKRSCDRSGDSSMLIMSPLRPHPHYYLIHLSLCMYMHRSTLVYVYLPPHPGLSPGVAVWVNRVLSNSYGGFPRSFKQPDNVKPRIMDLAKKG